MVGIAQTGSGKTLAVSMLTEFHGLPQLSLSEPCYKHECVSWEQMYSLWLLLQCGRVYVVIHDSVLSEHCVCEMCVMCNKVNVLLLGNDNRVQSRHKIVSSFLTISHHYADDLVFVHLEMKSLFAVELYFVKT
jgi:hypothetical protein